MIATNTHPERQHVVCSLRAATLAETSEKVATRPSLRNAAINLILTQETGQLLDEGKAQ